MIRIVFNLYSGTRNYLSLVTVTLRGGKKHRATTVSGITCLWDSEYTNIMINRKQTKYYEPKLHSNKVEYGTDVGVYCTAIEAKVPFGIPEFLSSMIINHRFHVDN